MSTTEIVAAAGVSESNSRQVPAGAFSSRLAFVLAAAGSAVGLGNVWKFPYIAGENGGGAFVLVYLVCVAVLGLPILMAEIAIGRRGGHDPARAMRRVAEANARSPAWSRVGLVAVIASFLLLGLYSVIAGWALGYTAFAASGRLSAAADAGWVFESLLASPSWLIGLHSVFLVLTIAIVARGVREGIERAARVMMPLLFALLRAIVAFAAVTTGTFVEAATFLLAPDFSRLTPSAVLEALGHSFFTLSVGFGVMMAYGSYLPKPGQAGRAAVAVAAIDTGVALIAGLAIFPFVFAQGLEPSAGPGLIFVTLPAAFAAMPAGTVLATTFFAFLVLAALTSSISILEPITEHLARRLQIPRVAAASLAGFGAWLLGIGVALSLNVGSEVRVFGRSFFDALDFLVSNVLLPCGGLAIAVFAGWRMSRRTAEAELGFGSGRAFALWRFAVRYVAPIGVAAVLLHGL
ncbi:MAG TPA: sodium-dependent transporter [Steroidobacteraceae bacterium]|nr:sodium-dependent transporter [Steroidobacteraceae bacterium]